MADDRFDDATYDRILARVGERNANRTFAELAAGLPDERFFVLRHDVDYSPAAALRLAEREAAAGVRATYFLLPGAPTYDLLSPRWAGFPARLVELGHDVGLHYDARCFAAFPRERRDGLLDALCGLLAAASGRPVTTIAMHQPALHGEDPFRDHPRYLNAFGSARLAGVVYVSDSCRAWRDSAWRLLTTGEVPPRLQLSLHPLNWDVQDRPREDVFRRPFEEAAAELDREREWLLAAIARHEGVLEHERRAQSPQRS